MTKRLNESGVCKLCDNKGYSDILGERQICNCPKGDELLK